MLDNKVALWELPLHAIEHNNNSLMRQVHCTEIMSLKEPSRRMTVCSEKNKNYQKMKGKTKFRNKLGSFQEHRFTNNVIGNGIITYQFTKLSVWWFNIYPIAGNAAKLRSALADLCDSQKHLNVLYLIWQSKISI